MKIIDLTYTIEENMQVYPGDPEPKVEEFLSLKEGGCNVSIVKFGTHTGTHIDAPRHYYNLGQSISEISAHRFVGKGILIDVTYKKFNETIEGEDLLTQINNSKKAEFIILKTGMEKYYGKKEYFMQPYLSEACASLIVKLGIKLVAIDAASVDSINEDKFHVHEILLKNDILIVENLKNLKEIKKQCGLYSFLPLKLNTDGSPIRAVYLDAYID